MRVADGALHVDADPGAVPQARRWVAERLAGTVHEPLVPDAELVVSELVTNALLHGAPPVTVSVQVGDVVRIEVGDGSRVAPMRGRARADAMTGRGIALVAALARDWGVDMRAHGKTVWCELAPEGAPPPEGEPLGEEDVDALLAAWDDDLDEPQVPRYTVSLGDVPTDLLLAAKAHVDNLLREFTLASHGAESGSTNALPPHLAELFEAVISGFAEARQGIKKHAIDAAARGAHRTTLTLTLPLDAADAGESYLAALDEIDSYARAARLLTLETPPQHRVFRRWYVESLVAQLRAAAAGEDPPATDTFERRLLAEVAAVEVARRAADRAARLQQVTAALAGTATAQDVGQVVVSEGVSALGASGGGLLVAEAEDHLGVTAFVGYDAELVARLRSEHPNDELPAAVAMRTGEPVWLESKEEREALFPGLTVLEPRTIAICAVPLCAGDRVLGALRFSFDTARLFDVDERRFVLTLAGQTAQALERADALAAARAANERLAFLAEVSAVLAESLDFRETLRSVARLSVPTVADRCSVRIVEDGVLVPVAVAPDGSAAGAADVPAAPYIAAGGESLHAPLAVRGRVLGVLSLYYGPSGRRYTDPDLVVATDLAHRAAVAIDNAQRFGDAERG